MIPTEAATGQAPLPLTTTFTPPSSCLQTESVLLGSSLGTTSYQFGLRNVHNTSACLPSGWSPNSYFSPGKCPSGYSIATYSVGVMNQTTQSRGYCCPAGYTYNEVPGSSSTHPCSSWVLRSELNEVPLTAPLTSGPTKTTMGLITAFAVSIRWDSEDFSTAVPDSEGGNAPLSTSAKAGIGIGVTTGVLIMIIIALAIFHSRRKKTGWSAAGYKSVRLSSNEEKGEKTKKGKISSAKKSLSASWSLWGTMGLDSWLYESIAVCFSIACLVAILCILQTYDGKLSPQLPHGVRLNTIVSVLATASKSSLLFAVGECINQLRWVSFRKSRKPLSLAQTYDNASRGPWGSFLMLFKDQGRSFVTIGALIMILALAFDPFVQQIISYPLQETPHHSSAAMVSQSRYLLPHYSNSTLLENAMNAGIWTDDFPIDISCPTGNCTWPHHRSIEMCSKCADVTSDAILSGWNVSMFDYDLERDQTIEGKISLSHGRQLDIPIQIRWGEFVPLFYIMRVPKNVIWVVNHQRIPVNEEPNYDGLNTTLGIKDPLLVVAYAELDLPGVWPTSLSDPLSGIGIQKVTKCALSFCARKYDISVSRGTPSVKVLDQDFGSFYTDPFLPVFDHVCWKPSASPISDWPKKDAQTPELSGFQDRITDQPNFEFCGVSPIQYANTFAISGSFSWIFQSQIVSKDGSREWMHDTMKDWYKSTFEIKRVNDLGLEKVMRSIASSISQMARQTSDSPFYGVAITMETHVKVQWPWLTLPVVLLVSATVLLISTAVTTTRRRINLWKSSIFPFLFHGLEKNLLASSTMSKHEKCESVSEMVRVANKMTVDLGLSNNTGRTMLRGAPQRASTLLYRESRRRSF